MKTSLLDALLQQDKLTLFHIHQILLRKFSET